MNSLCGIDVCKVGINVQENVITFSFLPLKMSVAEGWPSETELKEQAMKFLIVGRGILLNIIV